MAGRVSQKVVNEYVARVNQIRPELQLELDLAYGGVKINSGPTELTQARLTKKEAVIFLRGMLATLYMTGDQQASINVVVVK